MRTVALLFLLLAVTAAEAFAAEEIVLPAPQKTGGPALFAAIDNRSSAPQSTFPTNPVPMEDLSTILWAASGHNRDGVKWTVPMALGRPPYCKIYVSMPEGAFLYDWEGHKLIRVGTENVTPDLVSQRFAKAAPTTLYVMGDGEELATMSYPISTECGILLAGAMSQNVYLACEGLGVGARLVYSMDRELTKEKFRLAPLDQPFFAILMGKP